MGCYPGRCLLWDETAWSQTRRAGCSPAAVEPAGKVGKELLLLPEGGAYYGALHSGLKHGFGVEMWANGTLYEGQWLDGLRHGRGRETSATGEVYHGEFLAGARAGTSSGSSMPPSGRTISSKRLAPRPSSGSHFALRMAAWGEAEVLQWLHACGLARLEKTFREEGVNGQRLLALDHKELQGTFNMLRYGERCRLLLAVRRTVARPGEPEVESPTSPVSRGSNGEGGEGSSADASVADRPRSPVPMGIPEEQPMEIPAEQLQLGPLLREATGEARLYRGWYLGKEVAVRALRGQDVAEEEAWSQTLAELATLRHPGLALLLGVVLTPLPLQPSSAASAAALSEPVHSAYVVSENLPGTTLQAWLARSRESLGGVAMQPAMLPVVLRVACGVAVAMRYLHSRSAWHLCLRPSAVLLDEETKNPTEPFPDKLSYCRITQITHLNSLSSRGDHVSQGD